MSVGCANCHEMKTGGSALVSSMAKPKKLSQLQPEGGCLTGEKEAVNYQLNAQQQKHLVAAIKFLSGERTLPEISANERVHQNLTSLNCYTCHSRETGTRGEDDFQLLGGIVDKTGGDSLEIYERDRWFVGTEAEMGDEGRHPPGLKLVGAKLKSTWLNHVISKGARDRPYMKTRMPAFGQNNADRFERDLKAADKLSRTVSVSPTESVDKLKAHGRFFVGSKGLSCIKCHTFGEFPSSGIPAINLATMTKRLNKDWFQVYMLKPSQFRRGTRMPESWPNGVAFFKDRLSGDPDQQIDAIWKYLSDGSKAKQPKGLVKTKMEIVADPNPVIYRNFIEGAGPRAIGVGYPERVNLAFDAQNCRLALLWQENFIDGSRHWTGRGQGYEPPLGENIIRIGEQIPFGVLEDDSPEIKFLGFKEPKRPSVKFVGYGLDEKGRPGFEYKVDGVTIADMPVPRVVDGVGAMTRSFSIYGPAQKMYYVAAVAEKIVASDSGYLIDDSWVTSIEGDGDVQIISQGNKRALIVKFDLKQGQVSFKQKYDWK